MGIKLKRFRNFTYVRLFILRQRWKDGAKVNKIPIQYNALWGCCRTKILKIQHNFHSYPPQNTYVRVTPRERMHKPTHTHAQPYTYVRVETRDFLFQARIQVACQLLPVQMLAYKDNLLHAVAILVIPIAQQAGFLTHQLHQLFFGSRGIP